MSFQEMLKKICTISFNQQPGRQRVWWGANALSGTMSSSSSSSKFYFQQNTTIKQQDCFLQKEARVCVSNAFVLEDSMFK